VKKTLRLLLTTAAIALIATLAVSSTSGAPPAIKIDGDTVEATSSSGASATFHVKAFDPVTHNPISVTCSPTGSGSGDFPVTASFPLGLTTVSCDGVDDDGNPVHGEATVTVQDTTPPTLGPMPGDINDTTESPSGKPETFILPTATDIVDPSPEVSCNHGSGETFPLGSTQVTCTASDHATPTPNTSAPGSFTVTITLIDHTAPTLSVPSSFAVETENPSGTAVTYSASATDNVDPAPTVSCNPASGANFPVGQTTVNCTASDHATPPNTSAPSSFTVTVNLVDHTPPTFSAVPADKTVEANGPGGSVATYTPPTAADGLDGPIAAVNCAPASGSQFPLGQTTVDCSATDSHGNTGHATFHISVVDSTPPNLIVPVSRSIYATSATGIPSSAPAVGAFLSAASASDIVDPSPAITNNAPAFLPVGPNTIDFFARDGAGNVTTKESVIVVLPQPPPGTPPLPIPPAPTAPPEVKDVKVTPLNGAVRIQWNAGGGKVEVTRSTSSSRGLSALVDETIVYAGTASSYTDRGLLNGIEYRYVVRAVDAAGNHSAGVAAVVAPRVDLLRSPKNGARLKRAPKLVWKADGEADYYNAQLMLNGVKVLSIWPTRASYALKKTWKYKGRKYSLKPGVYTWFVWPGYGSRVAVDYGPLMGSRTFRIVR
jgi:HYR domain